jgi:hypothetical protein
MRARHREEAFSHTHAAPAANTVPLVMS